MIAVCDAFDAMTTDRPYRGAFSTEEAIAELRRCAGQQFDPLVVMTFIERLQSDTVPRTLVGASIAKSA